VGPLIQSVTDLGDGSEAIRRRRYGVIEARDGEFRRVVLRPWPKLISSMEALLCGGLYHSRWRGDICRLYYAQPWRFPGFLTVGYIVSARGTSYRTFRRAAEALDEVARIKGTDALLCELATWRISTAMMERWGWQRHCPSRWRRHYIKRFYGQYPPRPAWLRGEDSPPVAGRRALVGNGAALGRAN